MNGYVDTIWIIRDITEQKRLASERESARSLRALAEVAAVLSHEIRNPLGSMELFAGLLADATAQHAGDPPVGHSSSSWASNAFLHEARKRPVAFRSVSLRLRAPPPAR